MSKLPSIVSEAYFSALENNYNSIKDSPVFLLKLIYQIIWIIPMIIIRFFIWLVVTIVSFVYILVSRVPLLRLPFLLLLTGYNIPTIVIGFIANIFDLNVLFELLSENINEARNELSY